jgi:hypothetical protein
VKTSSQPQSATSLPRAPRDDAHARSTKYLVMMAVRILCFALMVLITPYGWYTWVLAAGAVFLPYVAVVIANVGKDVVDTEVVTPERMLPAAAPEPLAPDQAAGPTVIRIAETPNAGARKDVRDPEVPDGDGRPS